MKIASTHKNQKFEIKTKLTKSFGKKRKDRHTNKEDTKAKEGRGPSNLRRA